MLSRLSILALLTAGLSPLAAQQDCASLTRLNLPHTTIVSAAIASEGRVPPTAASTNAAPVIAPPHCAVQAVTRPTKDSEIRFDRDCEVAAMTAFSALDHWKFRRRDRIFGQRLLIPVAGTGYPLLAAKSESRNQPEAQATRILFATISAIPGGFRRNHRGSARE